METSELRWEREERARCAKSRWTDSTKDLGSASRDLRVQDTRLGGDTVEASKAEQERQGGCPPETRARWTQILPEALQSGLQSDSPWGFIRGRSSAHTTLEPKKFVFIVTSA